MNTENNLEENTWQEYNYFPSSVYILNKPSFLDVVRQVSDEYIEKAKSNHDLNEIYPVYMSDNYVGDPRLNEFASYIAATAWNILNQQGYNMDLFQTVLTDMWTQQHYKHSSMEEHTHKFGSVISGFYFIESPKNCSRPMLHDPRPAKIISGLPERNMNQVSHATDTIHFEPVPGMFLFTNSWLPHSFTRHAAPDPIKFVHFNLSVQRNMQICQTSDLTCKPDVEIV